MSDQTEETLWKSIQTRARERVEVEDEDEPPPFIRHLAPKPKDEDDDSDTESDVDSISDFKDLGSDEEDTVKAEKPDVQVEVVLERVEPVPVTRYISDEIRNRIRDEAWTDEIALANSFNGPTQYFSVLKHVNGPFGPMGQYGGVVGGYTRHGWHGVSSPAGVQQKNEADEKRVNAAPWRDQAFAKNREFDEQCKALLDNKVTTQSGFLDLSADILLQIISFLDPQDFLTIVHTSNGLKEFMAIHAPAICNAAILAKHQKQAEFLQVEHVNGWLSPTNKTFLDHQSIAIECSCELWFQSRYGLDMFEPWEFHPRMFRLVGKLNQPGPMLLCFLEKHPDLAFLLSTMEDLVEDNFYEEDRYQAFVQSLEVWTDFRFQHSETRMEERGKALAKHSKYEEYYMAEHKKRYREKPDVKRPRELMWYFGISGTRDRRQGAERSQHLRDEVRVEVLRRAIESFQLS